MILGASPDSVAKQAKFRKKYDLPFTLLADTETTLAQAYGVWVEKSMYGKKYMGIARTTFVIDASGRIARVFERVKADGHAEEVSRFLEGMNEGLGGTSPAPRTG